MHRCASESSSTEKESIHPLFFHVNSITSYRCLQYPLRKFPLSIPVFFSCSLLDKSDSLCYNTHARTFVLFAVTLLQQKVITIPYSIILYRCRKCGEPIRDGDTAYLLDGSCYCPGCVENALIIARPDVLRPSFPYRRNNGRITGFPAGIPRNVCCKPDSMIL